MLVEVPVVPELIGLISAVAALAFMYVRAPQSSDSHIDITRELPVQRALPAPRQQLALPAPIVPSPEPYHPRSGPAWITVTGEFVIAGNARRAGDLALAEVPLGQTLRRPPLASRVADGSPPPGCASLAIVTAENCAATTLRVVTSGQPRSSTTALVLGVNARKKGPLRLRGRFEVRA